MGLDNIVVNKQPVETDGECQGFAETSDKTIKRLCSKLPSGIAVNYEVSFRGKCYAEFINTFCNQDLYVMENWTKETYKSVADNIYDYIWKNYFRRKWELLAIRNMTSSIKTNTNKISIDTIRLVNIELKTNYHFGFYELKALYDLFRYMENNTDKLMIISWS